MNARQRAKADTCQNYIRAVKSRLDALSARIDRGDLKDRHHLVEDFLFLIEARLDDYFLTLNLPPLLGEEPKGRKATGDGK